MRLQQQSADLEQQQVALGKQIEEETSKKLDAVRATLY